MNHKKSAVTLIEIIIVVILSSVIILAVMNLFSSGMKGSAKGLAHQANMESASIIMSQIEYDLLRAVSFSKPDPGVNEDSNIAIWDFCYGTSNSDNPSTVTYSQTNDGLGVSREVKMPDGKVQKTILAKSQKVNLIFKQFNFNTGSKKYPVYKQGMLVEVTVSSKDNKKVGTNESFSLKRLIVVRTSIIQ